MKLIPSKVRLSGPWFKFAAFIFFLHYIVIIGMIVLGFEVLQIVTAAKWFIVPSIVAGLALGADLGTWLRERK